VSCQTPFCRVDKFQSVLTPYLWASAGAPSSPSQAILLSTPLATRRLVAVPDVTTPAVLFERSLVLLALMGRCLSRIVGYGASADFSGAFWPFIR